MRTWVKATIGGVALLAVVVIGLAGTSAYYVLRNLDSHAATETEGQAEFQALRTRFGTRPPLIEIVDPLTADIRVNRPTASAGQPVSTLHVLTWDASKGQLFRTEVPLWLMRFSTTNILSRAGVAPERFRLTVQDIEHYGPGVILDFSREGKNRVVLWVE